MDVQRLIEMCVATALTSIAGFVDAVGFVAFARIYTANMSGNSVALGIAMSQRNWTAALLHLWPVLLYVLGLVFGRTLLAIGAQQRTRHIAATAFGCEVVLLVLAMFVGVFIPAALPGRQYLAIALLASAMGIQNSTLTRFSSFTLHTGFVTGTLVKLSERFVASVVSFFERLQAGQPFPSALMATSRQKSSRVTLFLALIWMAYVGGAGLGAWRDSVTQSRSLLYPIAGLALLMILDLIWPLAQDDEGEQRGLQTAD